MRLTLVRSSLPLVLVAAMMWAQPAKPLLDPRSTQAVAVKDSSTASAHAQATSRSKSHHARRRRTSRRKGAKRTAYRPAYTQNSVEIMNGDSTQKVVFNNDDSA